MGIIEDIQLQLDNARISLARLSVESQSNNPFIANIAGRQVGAAAGNVTSLQIELSQALQNQESSFVIDETPTNTNIKNLIIIASLVGGAIIILR